MNSSLMQVFSEYENELLGFITKRLGDKQSAQDIVQELFLKINKQPDDSVIQYPKAYLFRMANNLVIDQLRQTSKEALSYGHELHEVEVEVSPERQLEGTQQLALVIQAINQLPNKTKEVVRLQRMQNYSKETIATQLGISINMVEKHLRKAVQHCRDQLKKMEK